MAELNRPIYEALVTSEDAGMLRISLVDLPAVESNFLAFAKEDGEPVRLYFVRDEERRIVRGVVMRADYPILRRNGDYEYYIVFRADTIRVMAEKYLAESRQNNVDEMHNHNDVDDVQMVQYFIKDTAAGIAPAGFEDIADGSLFAEFHVLNDEVWAKVKDGTYRGFSLEGAFELVPEEMKAIPKTDKNMSKIKRFKAALARLLAEFGNISTDKGVLAWDGDEDLKEGDAVFIEDADGNRETAPDGDYVTTDAKTVVVADGKVAEIRDPEAEVAPEAPAQEEAEKEPEQTFGRIATDNGELVWEGEGDLEAGREVFVERDGELVPAPDGEYRTEDGKTIVVVEGRVAEIRDPEAEVAPESEPAVDEEKAALRAENAELRAQVETLTARVAELSRMPAAKPAHEEVKETETKLRRTGNKGLDRIAALMEK
jgi:ketosteroid isomerase-like protein